PRAEGGWGAATAMLLCSVAVVAIGLYPGPLVGSSQRASQAVQKAEARRQKDESEQAVSRNRRPEAKERITDSRVGIEFNVIHQPSRIVALTLRVR
ncbi:MAG: hypothetical protein WD403_09390, partial [Pirellulales bacterium]